MKDLKTIVVVPILVAPLTLIGLFLYYAAIVVREKRKYKHIPGPDEPSGIFGFISGNINQLIEEEKKGNIIFDIHLREMKKHNVKTVKLRLFQDILLSTCDARIIKEVLIEQDAPKYERFYQNFGYPAGMRFVGNGLVTELDHDKWRHKRSLFNPGFHKQALMQYLNEFNDKGDILMKHLKELAEAKPNESISLLENFNHAALDVIASVAFSMNVDSVNDPNNNFNKYIFESLDGLKEFFRRPLIKFNPTKWFFLKRYKKLVDYLRDIGRKQIESRIEALKNNETMPDDILTTILKSHETEEFCIEDMVDQFVTFFLAGQETTANSLTSAFLELSRNPDVLQKLRNEVDSVLGSRSELKFDDLHKLKYTSCVFKEALRMYPPVASFTRVTNKDIEFDDIFLPKNTIIGMNLYAAGRNEELFDEPLKFNPDRFLKEDSIKNYTFFPFSLGSRNCIGQNFAQIEAKVLMAKFIQNFDFKLDPNQSFSMYVALTMRPKDGVKCFLKLRK